MRTGPSVLVLLAIFTSAAHAQVCKKAPPPFLAGLLPETVSGFSVEFSTSPGAGCMALYRPPEAGARQTRMWASVSVEAESSESLGATGESVTVRYAGGSGARVLTISEWPVVFTVGPVGDDFVTVRGSVRIKVSVKNGDHGDGSVAFATAFFERMLPKIPCG